jgi:hypothetical protein
LERDCTFTAVEMSATYAFSDSTISRMMLYRRISFETKQNEKKKKSMSHTVHVRFQSNTKRKEKGKNLYDLF